MKLLPSPRRGVEQEVGADQKGAGSDTERVREILFRGTVAQAIELLNSSSDATVTLACRTLIHSPLRRLIDRSIAYLSAAPPLATVPLRGQDGYRSTEDEYDDVNHALAWLLCFTEIWPTTTPPAGMRWHRSSSTLRCSTLILTAPAA
jgi:hypothetical protein